MICTNCFDADYQVEKTDISLDINGATHILRDLSCETCPACGDVSFTQDQKLEIERKRIALEFSVKPVLTPAELKALRAVLNMTLNEICDLLHINYTYGRWERGQAVIPLDTNLLIHNLVEIIPDGPVNIFEKRRQEAIEKANTYLLKSDDLSLGEYLQQVMALTCLMPDIVSAALGILPAEFARIENNITPPDRIPPELAAKIARYFNLPFDTLVCQLNELQKITFAKQAGSPMLERTVREDRRFPSSRSKVNLVRYNTTEQKQEHTSPPKVSEEYLARVKTALKELLGPS